MDADISPDAMSRLNWAKTENHTQSAIVWICDGEFLRLFVAAQPRGTWDWRVWNTLYGHNYRFGLTKAPEDAVEAAESAAAELAVLHDKAMDVSVLKPPVLGGDDHAAAVTTPRCSRRVWEKILVSFHLACDDGDVEIARMLLRPLDAILMRRQIPQDAKRRRVVERVVAAHDRYWHLINPHSSDIREFARHS